jgi:hypothetical protein
MKLGKLLEHPIPSGVVVVFICWFASEVFLPKDFRLSDTWGGLSSWLRRSIFLDRGELIALLALTILLTGGLVYWLTSRRLSVLRGRAIAEARAQLEGRTPAQPPSPAPQLVPVEKPLDPAFKLDAVRLDLLMAMQKSHPHELDLTQAHKAASSHSPTRLHTERQLEVMEQAGIVRARFVNENATYYRLTRIGADYSLKYGDKMKRRGTEDNE